MGRFIKIKLSIVCLETVHIYIGAGLRSAVRKRVERFQGKLVKALFFALGGKHAKGVYLAKEKKKLNLHLMKWEKLLQSLSEITLLSLVLIFLFIYLFTDLVQFYLLYTAVIFFFFFNVKRKNTIKYKKKRKAVGANFYGAN